MGPHIFTIAPTNLVGACQTTLGCACQSTLGCACRTSLGYHIFTSTPDEIFFHSVIHLTSLKSHILTIAP